MVNAGRHLATPEEEGKYQKLQSCKNIIDLALWSQRIYVACAYFQVESQIQFSIFFSG